ncbi:MAG: leucyl aminopeptidase [Candidatus Gastranaerophilales bacterium]
MDIKIIQDVTNYSADVLVINKFRDEMSSQEIANKFAIEKDNFEGKLGETYVIHTLGQLPQDKILVVGLGEKSEFNADKMRFACSKVMKKLQQIKAKKACFDFNLEEKFAKEAVIGLAIADYSFDKYKSEKPEKIEEIAFINFSQKGLDEGETFAQALKTARDIANEPAQYATPTKLAEIASSIEGLKVSIFDENQIKDMKMGAYLGVAQGSAEPPRFIHMSYVPQNPKKRIAIIGKGVCFDSGGLDLKPASGMLTMKHDMCGAAAVLGVMQAISKLLPDVEVNGIIAACENMPSGSAYKPGDILTAKNGKTIEIDNTDAEGRLTLADAITYACDLNVDEIIDIATLTGAVVVALGNSVAGIMGNNDELISEIIELGNASGEKFWQLPLFEDYFKSLKSDVADMKNTGSRMGGSSTAGTFLKQFVDENIKWAHIDIAGTAYFDNAKDEFCPGATGAGVRTLLNYLIK